MHEKREIEVAKDSGPIRRALASNVRLSVEATLG